MTSQYRTHAEIAGALAVASLGGATPAGADPNPTRRNVCRQTSTTPGPCYTSHNPSIPAAGHDFRRIDEPPSGNRLEWDDAAIGAGGVPRLVLAFASGVAAITFRHRRAEVLEMS